jgi:hypothetical protein
MVDEGLEQIFNTAHSVSQLGVAGNVVFSQPIERMIGGDLRLP